jgi:hypothetical protein
MPWKVLPGEKTINNLLDSMESFFVQVHNSTERDVALKAIMPQVEQAYSKYNTAAATFAKAYQRVYGGNDLTAEILGFGKKIYDLIRGIKQDDSPIPWTPGMVHHLREVYFGCRPATLAEKRHINSYFDCLQKFAKSLPLPQLPPYSDIRFLANGLQNPDYWDESKLRIYQMHMYDCYSEVINTVSWAKRNLASLRTKTGLQKLIKAKKQAEHLPKEIKQRFSKPFKDLDEAIKLAQAC